MHMWILFLLCYQFWQLLLILLQWLCKPPVPLLKMSFALCCFICLPTDGICKLSFPELQQGVTSQFAHSVAKQTVASLSGQQQQVDFHGMTTGNVFLDHAIDIIIFIRPYIISLLLETEQIFFTSLSLSLTLSLSLSVWEFMCVRVYTVFSVICMLHSSTLSCIAYSPNSRLLSVITY